MTSEYTRYTNYIHSIDIADERVSIPSVHSENLFNINNNKVNYEAFIKHYGKKIKICDKGKEFEENCFFLYIASKIYGNRELIPHTTSSGSGSSTFSFDTTLGTIINSVDPYINYLNRSLGGNGAKTTITVSSTNYAGEEKKATGNRYGKRINIFKDTFRY